MTENESHGQPGDDIQDDESTEFPTGRMTDLAIEREMADSYLTYAMSGNTEQAIGRAMHHSGRAMTSTSIILMLGFSTFMAADMANIERFGFLIGII